MANPIDVQEAALFMVNSAMSPGGTPVTPYKAAVGWPPVGVLQAIAKGGPSIIAVYDRKLGKNTTRWNPHVISQTITTATLTSAVSPSRIAPGQTAHITLGGSVTSGDAVSALATVVGGNTGAVVAIGTGGDTPSTMATKLRNLINSDSSMAGVLTATASGSVVTVTNVGNVALALASYTGNGGTQVREIGRRDRPMQIVVWTQTEDLRNLIVSVISPAIQLQDIGFGPTLADNTLARLSYTTDYDIEDNTLEDVYRHDFMVTMDYAVTTTDLLYSVLAPVTTIQGPT